ncbi:hypothetical protein DHEL01_v201007 [Diaporthe helianthi]|uniref:J domain-containing protein n=1 Tax=Diaporthe helianthi TaxID=158607 RepID=A0A2P5IDL6_DIAHE|nr:hypothetical protein DHEL01_v201007 [Diaporthe helianthi]
MFLAWAVFFVGLNLARILAYEVDLQKVPEVTEAPKPPNYYQKIGVSPLISEDDLRAEWKKYGIKHHPDKKTLTIAEHEDYIEKQRIFNTLLNGVLRCQYDKKNRIKGRWRSITCQQAFNTEGPPKPKAHPQARPAAPIVTVEVGPGPENRVPSVNSVPGVKAVKVAAAKAWNFGFVYEWVRFKAAVADGANKVFSALEYFQWIHVGNVFAL